MTNDEIRELIQIFSESGLAEMEVKRGEDQLRLRRAFGAELLMQPAPTAPAVHSVQSGPAKQSVLTAAPAPASAPTPAAEDYVVKSPIVGTFYESAKPGEPPFVRVGDRVEPGTVLCIIESMKLMNEIESEASGMLAERLVENGQAVEYGQPLFVIRKSG